MPPTTAYGAWIIGVKRASGNTKLLMRHAHGATIAKGVAVDIKKFGALSYGSARRLTILSKVKKNCTRGLADYLDAYRRRRSKADQPPRPSVAQAQQLRILRLCDAKLD